MDQQAAQVLADVEQAALAALEREVARLRAALPRVDPAGGSDLDLDLDLGEEPSHEKPLAAWAGGVLIDERS